MNVDVALAREEAWLLIVRGADESHAPGTLSLVGGTLEADAPAPDILEVTARREVHEEVGIEIDGALTYVESSFFVTDAGAPVLNVVFRAEVPSTAELRIASPEEVASVTWRTLAELRADDGCPPWTLQSIERAAAVRS